MSAKRVVTQTEPNPNRKHQVQYNRHARFEYSIEETFDAGMELVGTEVKSIRRGAVNLRDAFCKIKDGEVFIYGLHIAPWEQGSRWNVDPVRPRRLLLHRKEIIGIESQMEQKGAALVPLALYFQRGFAKLELGLGRGKKLFDKREDIAKRDVERDMRRALSGRD